MALYLISYDIPCNKRRQKIHKILSTAALSLQFSVFLVNTDKTSLIGLLVGIAEVANKVADNIICITVDTKGFYRKLSGQGQQGFLINHRCQVLNDLIN
jgi:CRISPR-associated endonuclease Cas2